MSRCSRGVRSGSPRRLPLLLGAALAPTDPVLASDVQVEGPTLEGDVEEIDEDDEVRFALTSEAGLNDGLAFPFVYAAIFLATLGPVSQWGAGWVAWELVGKVVVGVLVGSAVGWGMARLAFRAPARSLRLAEVGEPLLALAALLLAYGAAEIVGGYGFLAVFACALTVRSVERDHDYHRHMHDVIARLETLLTLVVLLGLGFALTNGLLTHLDWSGVLVGVALVLVIRPVAGWSRSSGTAPRSGHGGHGPPRAARRRLLRGAGVGSIYYVAYAAGAASFPEERVAVVDGRLHRGALGGAHGILATPVMRRLDALQARPPDRSAGCAPRTGMRWLGWPHTESYAVPLHARSPSPSRRRSSSRSPGRACCSPSAAPLSSGRREALLTVVGNALGILTQICALAVGLGPLIAASAIAYTALKVVGAWYLRVARGAGDPAAGARSGGRSSRGCRLSTPSLHAVRAGLRRRRDQPQDDRVLRGAAAPVRRADLAGAAAARGARCGVRGAGPVHGRHGGPRGQPGSRLVRLVAAPDGAGRRRRWA